MKKIIIIIQLVLVCFLYNASIYAQSKLETGIIGLKNESEGVRQTVSEALAKLSVM